MKKILLLISVVLINLCFSVSAESVGKVLEGKTSEGRASEWQVSGAQLREPMPGQTTAVAFLKLTNQNKEAATLISVSMENSRAVEIHEHSHVNGMMRMRRVPSIEIAPAETVVFQSGGYHFMVFGYVISEVQPVLVLEFSDEVTVKVPLVVIKL